MGNKNNKPSTMPLEGAASFYKLEEEITCSVCFSELTEPVSITCGHTFCRKCIMDYWSSPQPLGYRCPECRKVCPRHQLIPVHRLRNLVTTVQLVVKEEQAKKETPAHAMQLVHTDGDGHLQLDEAAVESCFMGSEISEYPVCLVCVLGEKRRGKSFLMNYILRALHSQEKGQAPSLGADDEPLQGFEWKSGTESTTKGIWIWSRPFILEHNGEKIAVYVLDTEGSLDIEGNKENCIKLSALSMVLSSYLIFNINSSLKATELDYLEMYLHIAELTGKCFSLQYLQHLDILVRDWHDCDNCTREDARSYIKSVEESLRKTLSYPLVFETLRSPSASCHLLPHPGKGVLRSGQGRLSDMDADFKQRITTYVCDLVRGVWRHIKTDVNGEKLTCGQLDSILREFVSLLQKEQYSFSSPLEMYFTYENHKMTNNLKKTFEDYMNTQAPITSSPFKIIGVLPKQMRAKVNGEYTRLMEEFEDSLQGSDDQGKQLIMEETTFKLLQMQEKFCDEYSKRFLKCAVGVGGMAGAGILSLAGGVVGAAVAGTILAAEAAALLGSTTAAVIGGAVGGSLTFGAIGGGVGAGVGGAIGHFKEKEKQKPEETESSEDKEKLVKLQERTKDDILQTQDTVQCDFMGNKNNKPSAMPLEGAASFYKLEEEITCSVCFSELTEPVSITCGHTFCRKCIMDYWSSPQPRGYRCPECRTVCPRHQLIPVHRLRNLVTTVQLVVKEEQAKKETPAHAMQLVHTDEAGHLQLDEAAVESCFLGSEISEYPVCLVCVIGEKRRGKSFLMNYILRALQCQEKGQAPSLGADDDPLQGFEWKSGTESTTKGIWIWSRPFILEHNGEKIAVYVLDTEGSLDIEGNKENCIKLSALSMVLSSYLIFNINSSLKATELDYLEMYLHIAELTGKCFSLQYLQHLDILVRDWHDCDNCTREDARSYIKGVEESLRKTLSYHLVFETLRSPSASCHLLPHPGKGVLRSGQGRLSDMDADFKQHITTYVCDLVRGVWRHIKTDVNGEKLTCGQLDSILREFVSLLQQEQYSFSSPLEMHFTYENHKITNYLKKTFEDYMNTQASITSSPFKILGVLPKQMRARVNGEYTRLMEEFEDSLQGSDDQGKPLIMEETTFKLLQMQEKFCDEYSKRYLQCAVGVGGMAGAGILTLAGGVVGAAVAGTILAAEAAALLGSTTAAVIGGAVGGSLTFGAIGGGVGAGVGGAIGRFNEKEKQKPDERESSEDKEKLVKPQERTKDD
ncbi:uncharacterized protein O3C94_018947 [Discoglossus pictus]